MAKRFTGMGVVAVLTAVGGLAALGACGGSDVTGDCTTLPSCCSQLTNASDKSECDAVVATADATSCGEAQQDFANDSLCVVSSGGGDDTSETGCAGLTACCATLGAGASTCEEEVTIAAGSDSTCSLYLTSYQGEGMCKSSVTVDAGSGGTGCAGLTTCCASLTGADQTLCDDEVTAAAGSDATCTTYLTSLQGEDMCGGGSSTDAGTGGTGCAGLMTCCASLSGEDQTLCDDEVTAAAGSDATCTSYLTSLQDEDMCGGTITVDAGTDSGTGGTGCASLSSCCSTLTGEEQTACDEEVSAGDDATCSSYLTSLQAEDMCGGTGTSTDAGTGGASCASLSSCCATLSGEEQTACDEEVTASAGDEATCGDYLTDLQDSGECG